ncbi:hypothetical protein [Nonomuraea sp. NPDC049158]|uniref:hypothetical protein n=1 Tax=Nonomuraea sp. NPDC049158 TaxID=3155649 RepID=UPI0033E36979
MLSLGIPLQVVRDIFGHSDTEVTMSIYAHLLEGDRRAATEAISTALLSKQLPKTPAERSESRRPPTRRAGHTLSPADWAAFPKDVPYRDICPTRQP